jgi:Tol biopolymer transport system component
VGGEGAANVSSDRPGRQTDKGGFGRLPPFQPAGILEHSLGVIALAGASAAQRPCTHPSLDSRTMVFSFLRFRVPHLIGFGMVPGLLLAACGQGEELAEPDDTSSLQILTVTSGGGSDPDGYAVRVDDGPELPIGGLDTVLRTGLAAGDYRVALSGLVEECRVQEPNPRLVALEPRRTAQVEFGVTCAAPPATGSIEVTVATTGSDLDPDGYVVSVDPAFADTVSANGTATIVGVPVGQRGVRLGGLAGNCTTSEPAQVVIVQEGQTTQVRFEVTCTRPQGRLLFSRGRAPTDSSFLITQASDGTSLGSPLSERQGIARAPAYSNDSSRIAYVGVLSGTVAEPHIITMNSDGSEVVAWEGCTASASRPVFSPDGEHFLCISPSAAGTTLLRIRLDQSDTRQLTPDSFNVVSASWSQDGSSIAFRVQGSDNPPNGIYRMNPDGSQITLIHQGADAFNDGGAPLWSPDGSQIVFTGDFGDLIVLNVARQEAQTIFTFPNVPLVDNRRVAAWSPDGARIAFAGTGMGIWLIAPDGTEETFLTGGEVGAGPSWSPDGSMLAFPVERLEAGTLVSRIFLVNADGTGLTQLTADPVEKYDTDPIWQP